VAAITGSTYAITNISACIHDSNEIPMATPLFRDPATCVTNADTLQLRVTSKSKMAAINRKYICNSEYLGLFS